jgi:hypothetical protein
VLARAARAPQRFEIRQRAIDTLAELADHALALFAIESQASSSLQADTMMPTASAQRISTPRVLGGHQLARGERLGEAADDATVDAGAVD